MRPEELFVQGFSHWQIRFLFFPELLEILEYPLTDVERLSMDGKYLVHFPAIYMLAYFREIRAYDFIIRIASLPDEQVYELLGDTITEDFGRILASVCGGL